MPDLSNFIFCVCHMICKKIFPKTGFLTVLSVLSALTVLFLLLSAFKNKIFEAPVTEVIKEEFLHDIRALHLRLTSLKRTLEAHEQEPATIEQLREEFYQLKRAYKKTEYFLEYLDPELAKSLNGAPIPKVVIEHEAYLTLNFKEPTFVTYPPEGLQVLEEMLFAEMPVPDLSDEALSLVFRLEEKLIFFRNSLYNQSFTDKQIFGSLREQLIRAQTMGITGFDTPAAEQDLELVAISLVPLIEALHHYRKEPASGLLQERLNESSQLVQGAIDYLQQNNDFDSFDRMHFIRELAEPAYGSLTEVQHLLLNSKQGSPDLSKAVNDHASGVFDNDFLQAGYYAKQDQAKPGTELTQLGKFLFFDPVLSANNKRSCASCHDPARAFTDGRTRSLAFDFKGQTRRNAPTLLNAVFSTAYLWDSRARYLQDQVPDVLLEEEELHGTYEEVVEKLRKSREYQKLFKKAFQGQAESTLNINTINRAIAAYVQSLVALNSPFDQYMRQETDDYSQEAIRGFNVFMGKGGCGTCHFSPVFNGTVPPRFLESETEVLGVPATADLKNPMPDADAGRGGVIDAEVFFQSFKTPTVRNAALTAPYMHNGVFATLEEVVEFYDLGGGAGLGLEVPNQTLPASPLNLTEEEKKDLISFLHTLTDTTGTTSVPERLPSFQKNASLNNRKVGGDY